MSEACSASSQSSILERFIRDKFDERRYCRRLFNGKGCASLDENLHDVDDEGLEELRKKLMRHKDRPECFECLTSRKKDERMKRQKRKLEEEPRYRWQAGIAAKYGGGACQALAQTIQVILGFDDHEACCKALQRMIDAPDYAMLKIPGPGGAEVYCTVCKVNVSMVCFLAVEDCAAGQNRAWIDRARCLCCQRGTDVMLRLMSRTELNSILRFFQDIRAEPFHEDWQEDLPTCSYIHGLPEEMYNLDQSMKEIFQGLSVSAIEEPLQSLIGDEQSRGHNTDPAEQLHTLYKKGRYVQVNLDPRNDVEETPVFGSMKQVVWGLREGKELSSMEIQDFTSWQRNTLLMAALLRRKKNQPPETVSTGIHLDWTEASNLLLPLGKVSKDTTCAVWTFWAPGVLHLLFRWLCSNGLYNENTTKAPTLSFTDLEAFKAHLTGTEWPESKPAVIVIEQKPGQIVSVPPGWLHQVVTVAPCLKIAWDFFKSVQTMPKLASIHQQLSSKYTRQTNAADYMALQGVASSLIKNYP